MRSFFMLLLGLGVYTILAAQPQDRLTNEAAQQVPSASSARRGIDVGDAPVLGPDDAPVAIIEFSDFQCPYSAQGVRLLKRLQRRYPGQIRWIFKHYPLRRIHADALLAHEAAVAAGEQGKFWQMHALLFQNQDRLKQEDLLRYARMLDLDQSVFAEALKTHRTRSSLMRDIVQGRKLHIGMTPTYFINGRRLNGVPGHLEFRELIKRELSKAADLSPAPDRKKSTEPGT